MSGGLHATTGPNIIFWDPQQTAMGNYTVKATFSLTKQPSHEVSYGLFIGGVVLFLLIALCCYRIAWDDHSSTSRRPQSILPV